MEKAGEPTSETDLQSLMTAVADAIMTEARRCLPARRRPKPKLDREARKYRGWARCLRNMLALVDRLVCGDITLRDRALQEGIRTMGRLGIAPGRAHAFSVHDWGDWGVVADDVLQAVVSKLARVHSKDPTRMRRLSVRLWRTKGATRAFFERLLRRGAQGKLDSAVDPVTRKRTWSPSKVKQLIAEQVGAAFQNRVPRPRQRAEGSRPFGVVFGHACTT
mgnify:CR=1 FL=1